jgi:hypothetical protein
LPDQGAGALFSDQSSGSDDRALATPEQADDRRLGQGVVKVVQILQEQPACADDQPYGAQQSGPLVSRAGEGVGLVLGPL